MRGVVVLDRAEVVHLPAAGEVQGDLAGAAAGADEAGLGADPGVVAAEGDGGQRRRRVAVADGLLVADLPGRVGELVDGEVADPGGGAGAHLHDRHDEDVGAGGRGEALDDGDLAVVTGVDHEAGEDGDARGVDVVGDDDRLGRDVALRDPYDDRPGEGRVEVGEHVGRGPVDDVGEGRLGVGVDDEVATALDGRGRGAGDVGAEVELVDAAVAPDLLGRGRQVGGGRPLAPRRPGRR